MLDDLDKDLIRRSREALATELRRVGADRTDRRYIRCPFHDDRTPSAQIKQAPGSGVWYFTCFTCGINGEDYFAVKARVAGQAVEDVLRDWRAGNPQGDPAVPVRRETRPEAPQSPKEQDVPVYPSVEKAIEEISAWSHIEKLEQNDPYTDPATGRADTHVLRFRKTNRKKTFLPLTRKGDVWELRAPDGAAPLFNRVRLQKVSKALLVEGEKCVREFTKLGFEDLAAVTSMGGSNKADRADWSPLAGKEVYIWPDNDAPGRKYAETARAELMKLGCQVHMVDISDLGLAEGEDVADYIEQNGGGADARTAIELVLMDAAPERATDALEDRLQKIARGEFRLVPFPRMERLTAQTQALLPGTVTTCCGSEGFGKSWFVLELAWRLDEAGEKVRLLMLEEDAAYWQNRALAQMSGQKELLDNQFVEDNPEWALEQFRGHRDQLERFARILEATGSDQRKLMDVAKWVEAQAAAGARVLIIDPITAAAYSTKETWSEDLKFLMRIKLAAERYGCSVILTTHPKGGKAGAPSLDGLAGGKAYTRFSQTVLWLRAFEEPQSYVDNTGIYARSFDYTKAIEIRKARNGEGGGRNLAISLNPANLCFEELGLVKKEGK